MSERITFCDSLQYRCAWSTEGGSMSGSFWKRCFSAPPNKMRILLEKSLLIFCFVWYLWLFWVPASNGWKNCLERMTFQLYSGRFCRKAESSERCSGVSVYDKKRSKLKIIENLRLPKKSRIAQNFIIISCMVTRFEIRDLNLDLHSIRHARMQAAAQQ